MKNITKILSLALVVLSLLSFKSSSISHEEPKTKEIKSKGYKVGDAATDFKLKNIDGKMVSLSDFKSAKGFIVIFTCNHCPYAQKYEERIMILDKKYKDLGYPVIAINPNDPSVQPEDDFSRMITRATEKGFTFPYLVDEGQKIYPIYGATKTPHVFILKKEGGKNIVKYIGAIDNNYEDPNDVSEPFVEFALESLLNDRPVKITNTVAIGCTIKVKK